MGGVLMLGERRRMNVEHGWEVFLDHFGMENTSNITLKGQTTFTLTTIQFWPLCPKLSPTKVDSFNYYQLYKYL